MQVFETQLRENVYTVLYLSKMFHFSTTVLVPMSCQEYTFLTLGSLSYYILTLSPSLLSSGLADWSFAS